MAVPDELRARMARMAQGELDELLAEARAEAREQVKAVLRDAYAQALLDQSTGTRDREARGAATPREEGDGWWVYCVVPADRELPRDVPGIAGDEAPQAIAADGLAAVVSRVPLNEFGEQPLRENLNDLGWLERTVRAHEAVLDAALVAGAVVPMRVCTIYRDDAQVRAMLDDRGDLFRDALARLAGKAEWGVKVVADRERLAAHVREHSDQARALDGDMANRPEGGAYLARKKLAALVRDEADRILDEVLRETHARLEEWASGSVVLPAQSRELAGYEGDMVFNGAYLVEHERVEAFSALLRDLGSQYAPLGLSFDLTGPWPAYNFADTAPAGEVRG